MTAGARTRGRTIALAALGVLVVVAGASAATIVGTPRADVIRGTPGDDRLVGRAGDDRLSGLGGRDVLEGGPGEDALDGGPGADRLLARDGVRDVLDCGAGRDVAVVDGVDAVRRCEVVQRPASAPAQPGPAAVENEKPGTPGWAMMKRADGRAIEAYAEPSVAPGERLTFHVSAAPEASYRIQVFRVGYYGGAGARLVTCLPSCGESAPARTRGIPHPTPDKLVHAGWPISQEVVVPPEWVSGLYVAWVLLTDGPQHGRGHPVWFTVREPAGGRRAPILVVTSQTTWQAYNSWGGGSLYAFNSPGGRAAARVAFDRPVDALGPAGADTWEAPLAVFLERHGYDVGYAADLDTARDPGLLTGRRLVVVSGHSEYWAKETRDAFDAAQARGIDLAFMGANAAYWQVRFEDGYRTIVSYKSAARDPEPDPALKTVMFRQLVPPRYECALMGIQHAGGTLTWTTSGDYTVTEAAGSDPWLRAGGLAPGDVLRGVVSREVDAIPGNQTASSSCGNRLTVLFHRSLGGPSGGDADAVRFTAPSGARVFASGSHQLVWGLEDLPDVPMRHGLVDPRLQRFALAMLDDLSGRARTP